MIANGCRGGLTRRRVVEPLGRMPVQANTSENCFPLHAAFASFVDNLFFVAPTAWKATCMADIFADELSRRWDQYVEPDSRQMLPVFAAESTDVMSAAWEGLRSGEEVLGHAPGNRASIEMD